MFQIFSFCTPTYALLFWLLQVHLVEFELGPWSRLQGSGFSHTIDQLRHLIKMGPEETKEHIKNCMWLGTMELKQDSSRDRAWELGSPT